MFGGACVILAFVVKHIKVNICAAVLIVYQADTLLFRIAVITEKSELFQGKMKIVVAFFVLLDFMASNAENVTFVENAVEVTEMEGPFGNCTAKEIFDMHTTCNTPFMHGMKKKKACMPLVKQALKCKFDLYKTTKCFIVDDIQGAISDMYNGTAEALCERAGLLESPIYQIEKLKGGGTNYSFPCSISKDKFVEEFKKCNSKMLEIWKNDTADPRICREYFRTKQCKKQLLDTKCSYTGKTKKGNDLAFGNYNPFCPGGVDVSSGTTFCAPFGFVAFNAIFLLAIFTRQQ